VFKTCPFNAISFDVELVVKPVPFYLDIIRKLELIPGVRVIRDPREILVEIGCKAVKIALVTGRIAYEMVREVAEKIMRENPGVEITVIQLPIPVAAMMTSEYLLRELPRHIDSLRDKDYVIVPGYTRGDVSLVSRELGLRIIKGPRYIYDLPQW